MKEVISKKTQAATEYIMIVGFVIVILIPSIYLYMRYSSESQDSVISVKVDAIANEITKAADQVYSYGEGSQTTVNIDFPKNVMLVQFQGREIVFTVINSKGGQSEIAKVSGIDLIGNITVIPGTKKINVKSLGNAVSVFVECNNNDRRCGSPFECDYYLEDYQGEECIMTCENNKWRYNTKCDDIGRRRCSDGACVGEEGQQFGG